VSGFSFYHPWGIYLMSNSIKRVTIDSLLKSLRAQCLLLASASVLLLTACAPKVGSPEWCQLIKEKPKGDLTMNEAKDFAKHCVFK
jgi:hypothetical protein